MRIFCLHVFNQSLTGSGVPFPDNPFGSDWIFILLLVPVVLYTILTFLDTGQVKEWSRTVISAKYAGTAFKGVQGNVPASVLFSLATILSFTTFIYFINIVFNLHFWNLDGFLLWLVDLGIVSGIYLGRIIISSITGEISGNRDMFREYIYNINAFYKFAGLFLTAINFMICYMQVMSGKSLIIIGLVIIGLMLFLRIVRLINIFIKRKSSLFYMILYLCALEITPVLVLIKFISGTF